MATHLLTVAIATAAALAQPTANSVLADRPNGPRSAETTHHVLVNATVHPAPGVTWTPGYVEFKDGVIVNAGPVGRMMYRPPAGARVHDLDGEHVFAAFIDPWVEVEAPAPHDQAEGRHWNDKVTPHRRASAGEGLTEAQRTKLREHGYAAAAIVPQGGVFAGLAAVVNTADPAADPSARNRRTYADTVFHALDFESAGWGRGGYPTSHPGVVALMRQTLSDADWQADNDRDAADNALSPLNDVDAPLVFDVDMELEHFLAADIAREFDRDFVLVGNGMEFKWFAGLAREHADRGFPVVLPLRFPKKPDVASVGKAESTELETMLEWEHAPTNPGLFADAGVTTALTTSKLPKGADFFDNLHNAIEHGLDPDDAHAMLTTTPAELLGLDDRVGSIERGKAANLVVASHDIFDADTAADDDDEPRFYDLFIDGRRIVLNERTNDDMDGAWALTVGDPRDPAFSATLTIDDSDEPGTTVEVDFDGDTVKARSVSVQNNAISFIVDRETGGPTDGAYVISATLSSMDNREALIGAGFDPAGNPFQWTATRTTTDEADDDENDDADADQSEASDPPEHPGYPFGPYAVRNLPEQNPLVFTGATLWTSSPDGVIENGTLIISSGRIAYAGPASGAPRARGATFIDASGLHITPGLIDAHSHTSLFRMGVNEAGQAVTAEVRIGDSLDPSAINWYRQLAMGVTTVLSLHGSANPIGGQSQTHKVRWGVSHPRDMRMQDAKPGIKFALGENVKQSNWGDDYTTRYPQTRMGVETTMRDRLEAARDYMEDRDARRDLELEAIAEILAGERLIHCHSYRQDEILMLCRLAEEFGFTIGTFTHGLEVYKVAETVQNHALGASLFSDWWAYKYEVVDAIPQAGPLQTEAGVLTSYNSDSDELARRMNLEAAKAQRYAFGFPEGDPAIDEQEALNFVTINPAIQLGIDDRVGSLEEGKDADLVVWSGHPLSVYSNVEHTFIDGREYFSRERDAEHRERIRAERERLIAKIIAAPDDAATTEPDTPDESDHPAGEGVDTPPTRRGRILADYMTSGPHPDFLRQGDCGCNIINHAIYYRSMND